MYVSIHHHHLKRPQTAKNNSEKYTNNFLQCKNNNEKVISVHNILVYFGQSKDKDKLMGLFET
jgi:hypothetical protein